MTGGFTIFKRAALLLLIWGVAGVMCCRALTGVLEYRQLSRDVGKLHADYQSRLDEYTSLLAEGEKLKHDPKYQVSLLKRNYGYTEPDETPIVVRVGE